MQAIYLPSFVDQEVPGGAIDGMNRAFTLANVPSPASSLYVWWKGDLLSQGVHYMLAQASDNGPVTVCFMPNITPQVGDVLVVSYRY